MPGDDPSGEAVDAVMVGLHRQFDYERLRIAATAVRRGARFIATNSDVTFPTPDGLIPGAGAIVAAVAAAGGAARSWPASRTSRWPPPCVHLLDGVRTSTGCSSSATASTLTVHLQRTLGCPFALGADRRDAAGRAGRRADAAVDAADLADGRFDVWPSHDRG